MANLIAYSEGGVRLFNRGHPLRELDAPLQQLFAAVLTYVEGQGATLLSCDTVTAKVVWAHKGQMLMILLLPHLDVRSDQPWLALLDMMHSLLLALLGQPVLDNTKAGELLPKLKMAYPILDHLLALRFDRGGLYLGAVDVAFPPNVPALQNALDLFAYELQASRCFLIVHGRVVVASDEYWSLSARDKLVLACFFSDKNELPNDRLEQIFFLPDASPDRPFRLLAFNVMDNVIIGALCGAEPSLQHVVDEVLAQVWQPAFEALETACTLHVNPCDIACLHPDILAAFVWDRAYHRCLSVVRPETSPSIQQELLLFALDANRLDWEWQLTASSSTSVKGVTSANSSRLSHVSHISNQDDGPVLTALQRFEGCTGDSRLVAADVGSDLMLYLALRPQARTSRTTAAPNSNRVLLHRVQGPIPYPMFVANFMVKMIMNE
ncbi:uncharacterized protein MONBRDRAFT_22161 [Monosiga brevicollis MX1]|uniref:FUZ/MON1/HPS1 second Longin domain-containing protein n=1 Tax=Monosiga brevicollis TaxID=81824 RepID=A9UPR2_MONBE|nr:uncharacterized protein MONBRDRAFT_22161 [Monosiga brevicollis MX1]EDQ92468.1 predicted protein [Monosiga brevicollis MX1]|eukprot:XP_001742230.1 hypothetical protein [Monosiga brevicollis MX1]